MARTVLQKMADRHEKKSADAFGGRLTSNSGAGWVHKGDHQTEDEVVEWLDNLDDEAFGQAERYIDLLADEGVHLGEP